MSKSKAVESSKSDDNSVPIQPSISLPTDLVDELHAFIALTNNYLMTISVQGDQILQSAEIMNNAMSLHKKLEEAKDA